MAVTEEKTVVPKWLMGVVAAVGSALSIGLMTWMTHLHQQTSQNTVELGKVATRVENIEQNMDAHIQDLKKTSESMMLKLDRLFEAVTDLRARSGQPAGSGVQ